MSTVSAVALIPARSGSRRIPGKNVKLLAGHPLLAYTIAAARRSHVFSRVVVSTDSREYACVASHYGAHVPWLRPSSLSCDLAPDVSWVSHALEHLAGAGERFDAFAILRPTSPFRTPATIRRAWRVFREESCDSVRAVEPCRQHPGKMWVMEGSQMRPMLAGESGVVAWHSSPYQALPEIHVQNASLEIAWTRVVEDTGTIAGERIRPFLTHGREGFDLNEPDDWLLAETLVGLGAAALPSVDEAPWHPEAEHDAA